MNNIISLTDYSARKPAAPDFARRVTEVPIDKFSGPVATPQQDLLAVEEPLQIRLHYPSSGSRMVKDVAITMRTPGHDGDLAAGFLFSEDILKNPEQILRIRQACRVGGMEECNRVTLELTPGAGFDPKRLDRHFYVTSSCGVCGKTSIELLRSRIRFELPKIQGTVTPGVIRCLPVTLRAVQSVFEKTGGLHAAALFDFAGNLRSVREDVGRHNAVDKLIGSEFLQGRLPLCESMMLLSGRASFELVQKALMAGISVVAAVGAPSSLAVEMAQSFGMTLIGFLRGGQFNVYSGGFRLAREKGRRGRSPVTPKCRGPISSGLVPGVPPRPSPRLETSHAIHKGDKRQ